MTKATQFNFSNKTETKIPLEQIPDDYRENYYYWLDIDTSEIGEAIATIQRLCVDTHLTQDSLLDNFKEHLDIQKNYICFTLEEMLLAAGKLISIPFRIIMGKFFILTITQKDSIIRDRIRSTYQEDFVKFSQSPGFLLYEIADHLSHQYHHSIHNVIHEIKKIQSKLFEDKEDSIFTQAAELMEEIMELSMSITSARNIFLSLATRKSPFVGESTQPFLERRGVALEQLSEDISNERNMLNEILSLYMGYESHKTNKIINRLTAISLIFLPLGFIVGVYGMNFYHMPELKWKYSYPIFWLCVVIIIFSLLVIFKRKKWL